MSLDSGTKIKRYWQSMRTIIHMIIDRKYIDRIDTETGEKTISTYKYKPKKLGKFMSKSFSGDLLEYLYNRDNEKDISDNFAEKFKSDSDDDDNLTLGDMKDEDGSDLYILVFKNDDKDSFIKNFCDRVLKIINKYEIDEYRILK